MVEHVNSLSDDETKRHPVSPFARIVPNGIGVRDGKLVARFTIVVTPAPVVAAPVENDKSSFDLKNWPSGILKRLEKGTDTTPWQVDLALRLSGETDSECCGLSAKVVCLPEILKAEGTLSDREKGLDEKSLFVDSIDERRKREGQYKQTVTKRKLDRLWRETIEYAHVVGRPRTGDDKPIADHWDNLHKDLEMSVKNEAIKPDRSLGTGTGVGTPQGERGQRLTRVAQGSERLVKSMNYLPQTDLALALEYERAEETVLALRCAMADCEGKRNRQAEALALRTCTDTVDACRKQINEIATKADELLAAWWQTAPDDIEDLKNQAKTAEKKDALTAAKAEAEKRKGTDVKTAIGQLRAVLATKPKKTISAVPGQTDGGEDGAVTQELKSEQALLSVIEKEAIRAYLQAEHDVLNAAVQDNRNMATVVYDKAVKQQAAKQQTDENSLPKSQEGDGQPGCAALIASVEKRRASIENGTNAQRITSWETHINEPEPADDDVDEKGEDALTLEQPHRADAGRAYFTIQSTPALARLYCLAFDLEAEIETSDPAQSELLDILQGKKNGGFVDIAVRNVSSDICLGEKAHCANPWTLSRVSSSANADGQRAFLPATRLARNAYRKNENREATQEHGFLPLSSIATDGRAGAPRFDLTSIDVRAAAQAYTSQVHHRVVRDIPNPQEGSEAETGEQTARPAARATRKQETALSSAYTTAGLALLDRGALAIKAQAMARKNDEDYDFSKVGDPLLDADDLTVGLRIDVGIPTGDGTPEWRSLCHRHASYGEGGEKWTRAFADAAMPQMAGAYDGRRRIAYDATTIALPDQLLPAEEKAEKTSETIQETSDVEVVVPEDVGVWTGAPLAVDIVRAAPRAKDKSDTKKQEYFGIDPCTPVSPDVTPFGRELSLPQQWDETGDELPPRLRFGWPYRVSVRAAYSGGVSAGVGDLDTLDSNNNLTYPRTPEPTGDDEKASEPYFRFLRQRPIERPVMLLAKKDVADPFGHMGHASARKMIVRTIKKPADTPVEGVDVDKEIANRAAPLVAKRIILPPSLDMEEVVRHGVLDQFVEKHPAGAYRQYRWAADEENGGFPVVCTKTGSGFNGTPYVLGPRSVDVVSNKEVEIAKNKVNPKVANISYSDAVLARSKQERPRESVQYFPDPCADVLVIALRWPGTDRYIEGNPISVDLKKVVTGAAYPNMPPVLLTVKAKRRSRRGNLSHQALDHTMRVVRFSTDDDKPSDGPFIEITLNVPAGESFDADCWFVPSEAKLRDWFALPQAMALLDDAYQDNLCADDPFGELRDELKKHLGQGEAMPLAKLSLVGPGGLTLRDNAKLSALAKILHDTMLRRPIKQFSGVTDFEIAHASNALDIPQNLAVSSIAEVLEHLSKPPRSLKDQRKTKEQETDKDTDTETNKQEKQPVRPIRFHRVSQPEFIKHITDNAHRQDLIDQENETAFFLTGDIEIDLARCSGFDLVIDGPHLSYPTMDDPNRDRAPIEKQAGTTPIIVDRKGQAYYKTARQIYGMQIQASGDVSLDLERAVLFELRDLPSLISGALQGDKAGTTRLRLEDLLYGKLKDTPEIYPELGGIAVTNKHTFSDPKSRHIEFSISYLPRTARLLSTAPREERDTFIPSQPLARELLRQTSKPARTLLPGTRRPSQPQALEPIQGFRWETKKSGSTEDKLEYRVTRQSVLRVPLERGWYSAGDNEKIGLILWPPDLFGEYDTDVLEAGTGRPVSSKSANRDNVVRYKASATHEKFRTIDLQDFRDEDLGPGGSFTTRWGADPTRANQNDDGHFIEQSDIPGFDKKRYVANLAIPLFDASNEQETGGGEETKAAAQPASVMHAGLLLFEPRFDTSTDRWYVDIELKHRNYHEPFVRLGLVRYNEGSRSDLRVSKPVVQWGQLMPERDVSIIWEAAGGNLDIAIRGRASERVQKQLGVWDSSEREPPHITRALGPTMYGVLFAEADNGRGTHTRRPVDPKIGLVDGTDGASIDLDLAIPRTSPWFSIPSLNDRGHFTWESRLEKLKVDLEADETLVLYLEEIEHRRPATYPDEPLPVSVFNDPAKDVFVESGPRSSAVIRLVSNDSTGKGD